MENKHISKEFIDEMIKDTLDVESRVKMIDRLIGQLEDIKLRQHYTNELNEMLSWYKLLQSELVDRLEAYIDQETLSGNIIDIYYCRVLKNLSK